MLVWFCYYIGLGWWLASCENSNVWQSSIHLGEVKSIGIGKDKWTTIICIPWVNDRRCRSKGCDSREENEMREHCRLRADVLLGATGRENILPLYSSPFTEYTFISQLPSILNDIVYHYQPGLPRVYLRQTNISVPIKLWNHAFNYLPKGIISIVGSQLTRGSW